MSIKVAIKKDDKKPYWISLDDFKKLLFEEKISTKGMPLAYPERVESFFNQIRTQKEITNIWVKAYPSVDIESELNYAQAWLLSNTSKPRKDFKKFCNNWLAKAMRNPQKTIEEPRMDKYEKSNIELAKQRKVWESKIQDENLTEQETEEEIEQRREEIARIFYPNKAT